jgi:hypothetical protein
MKKKPTLRSTPTTQLRAYSIVANSTSLTNLDYDEVLSTATTTPTPLDTLANWVLIMQFPISIGGLDSSPSLTPTSKNVLNVKNTKLINIRRNQLFSP